MLYHKKGNTTSIDLKDIFDIRHRKEILAGDIIEIESRNGKSLKIEIAPLNQGMTFVNSLMNAWDRVKE